MCIDKGRKLQLDHLHFSISLTSISVCCKQEEQKYFIIILSKSELRAVEEKSISHIYVYTTASRRNKSISIAIYVSTAAKKESQAGHAAKKKQAMKLAMKKKREEIAALKSSSQSYFLPREK